MPAVTADTAAAVGGAVPFKRGKKKLLIIVARGARRSCSRPAAAASGS